MVRSYWKAALALALLGGAALGQQLTRAQSPPAATGERLVTIQEPGKPAQKCRILSSWRLEDGTLAHKVQAVDTGEISTLIDSPSPRVIPWDASGAPPAITPASSARLQAIPSDAAACASCDCPDCAGVQGGYRTVQESGRAPM